SQHQIVDIYSKYVSKMREISFIKIIVRVQKEHVFCSAQGQATISCGTSPAIGSCFPPHAIAKGFDDLQTFIYRPIVDDDNFEIWVILIEHTLDSSSNPLLCVPAGNDHCH